MTPSIDTFGFAEEKRIQEGTDYWRQCKPEIEAQLAEEAALVE